jgi:hypothetical protein
MKLPYGYEIVGAGADLYWRNRGVYTDEIRRYYDFNSMKFNANRFRKINDEIIKEKVFDSLDEAIKFLED